MKNLTFNLKGNAKFLLFLFLFMGSFVQGAYAQPDTQSPPGIALLGPTQFCVIHQGTPGNMIIDVVATNVEAPAGADPANNLNIVYAIAPNGTNAQIISEDPYVYNASENTFEQKVYVFTGNQIGGFTFTATITNPGNAVGFQTGTASASVTTSDIVIQASAPAILCYGGTSTITASKVSGSSLTIHYSIAPNPNSAPDNTTGIFPNLPAGVYTVTGYINLPLNANAKCPYSVDVTITQPSTPLTCTATPSNPLCNSANGGTGGTITVTATGGTGTLTYSKDGINFQASNVFSGLADGPYTITTKDANNCTTTCQATITSPPALLASSTHIDDKCFGGSDGSVTLTFSGGTGPYLVSFDGGPFVAQTSPKVYGGLTAKAYTWTVKDANSCTKSGSETVGQPVDNPISIFCPGADTLPSLCGLTAQAAQDIIDGAWVSFITSFSSNRTAATSNISLTFNPPVLGATPLFNAGGQTITATYTITDKDGCYTNFCSTTFVYKGCTPLCEITSHTDANCYGAATGSITAKESDGVLPYTIYLYKAPDLINPVANSGVLNVNPGTFTFLNLTAGNYVVAISDANNPPNPGASTCIITIAQPTQLICNAVPTNPLCNSANGGTGGTITVTASGGTGTLMYSKDGINFQASNVFSGLANGPYTITTKDANNCTTTCQATITAPAALTCNATPSNPLCNSANGGTGGTITVTAIGGTGTLTYSKDGINFQASNVFSGLANGPYTITTKDANNCTTTCQATITAPAALTCNAVPSNPLCNSANGGTGGTITVTAIGGTGTLTYSKDGTTFQPSNVFTGLADGPYTITTKDANGCKTTCQATIKAPAALVLTLSSTPVVCQGPNTGSVTATFSGGTGPFTLILDNGSPDAVTHSGVTTSPNVFTNVGEGSHTVSFIDANGCTKSATVTVGSTPCVFNECTLGYWKYHTNRWCSAYTTCMLYKDVFTSAPTGNLTLLQALNAGGGGASLLERQSVAALLNSCGMKFDLSTAAVIAEVNVAWKAGGNAIGNEGSRLDGLNSKDNCNMGGTSAEKGPSPGCPASATAKSIAAASETQGMSSTVMVKAYPNPFKDHLNFDITSDVSGNASLQIFNLLGQKVFDVYHGYIDAGTTRTVEFNAPNSVNQTLIYVYTIGDNTYTGRLIMKP